eukprot:10599741-Lingulodinium_polyedra.AAC.1
MSLRLAYGCSTSSFEPPRASRPCCNQLSCPSSRSQGRSRAGWRAQVAGRIRPCLSECRVFVRG